MWPEATLLDSSSLHGNFNTAHILDGHEGWLIERVCLTSTTNKTGEGSVVFSAPCDARGM